MARGRAAPAEVPAQYLEMVQNYRKEEKHKRLAKAPSPRSKRRPPPQPSPSPPPPQNLPAPQFYESEQDSDSSEEWENLEIEGTSEELPKESLQGDPIEQSGDVVITLDKPISKESKRTRDKTPRAIRILYHKLGLLCWIHYSSSRNRWLSASEVRDSLRLRYFLAEPITEQLFPARPGLTPFLKSKLRVEGLRHAMVSWQSRFSISESTSTEETKEVYVQAISSLCGSMSAFCQGFCGLCRAIGLEARLVCSLQPPDITSSLDTPRKRVVKPSPIWWTEVWDPWAPGWITVDVLTSTVIPPSRTKHRSPIVPALTDTANVLRYCIAFAPGSGAARDVTRRYADQFNARTRKKRLEYYGESGFWLSHLSRYQLSRHYEQRDLEEIRELHRWEATEGLPSRIQDFVGHPFYVLEHQLHQNQVLNPNAKPCGTVAWKSQVLKVFHREDVMTCHSAQTWYRRGFVLREGVQPQLHRKTQNRLTGEVDDVALYSADCVTLYEPPSVDIETGLIPKSEYNTVDIFVPSMTPRGAVHVVHPRATAAAKLLDIDFANVVTGVEFGREGPKSVFKGIVVAAQYMEALSAVLNGFDTLQIEQEAYQRELRILMLWRRYIVAIQIWDRIERMNPDFSRTNEPVSSSESSSDSENPEAEEVAEEYPPPSDDDGEAPMWEPAPSDDEWEPEHESNNQLAMDPPNESDNTHEQAYQSDTQQSSGTQEHPTSRLESASPISQNQPSSGVTQTKIRLSVPRYQMPRQKPNDTFQRLDEQPFSQSQLSNKKSASSKNDSDSSDYPELLDELSESEL